MNSNGTNKKIGKILVVGAPFWAATAATMLQRAGLQAEDWQFWPKDVPALFRWCRPLRALAYAMNPHFRQTDVVHCISPPGLLRVCWMARILRKRIVMHWIGSDVLRIIGDSDSARRLRTTCSKLACAHFADSPDIVEELKQVGIDSALFRLLPDTVVPLEEMPLPDQPAVLTYWSHERRDFYGGPIVDILANEFPSVPFYVVGSDGRDEPQHPNMTYLGRVDEVEPVYRKVSVFLRLPKHDSLSAMVLEMLARGRWVVYTKPFPHTTFATTAEEVKAALKECLSQTTPNQAGKAHVLADFSPVRESERIRSVYESRLA